VCIYTEDDARNHEPKKMDSIVRGSDVRDCCVLLPNRGPSLYAVRCVPECPQVFVQPATLSTDGLGGGAE
jgi:hypothetical protein